MATTVTIRAVISDDGHSDVVAAVGAARAVVEDVARTCTRFDPDSDLSRANSEPDGWHQVSSSVLWAVAEAEAAHRRTGGRFDPRVHDDLVRLGYARSLTCAAPDDPGLTALRPRPALPRWRPRVRRSTSEINLGGHRVDLGGIGKGLAVRWASERLRPLRGGHLVEAGGDVYCAGVAADGDAWRVAIEDPRAGDVPVAVLGVTDAAVATSSVRVRQWLVGGRPVHHLIDPLTGLPGGDGLLSVSVVDDDPAAAEVWSKTLFLTGELAIATAAAHFAVAALWVTTSGAVRWSAPMSSYLRWHRPGAD